MLRKSVPFILVMLSALLFRIPVIAQGVGHNFPVDTNYWAYVAVTALMEEGFLEGYPDGTFRGNRAITRDEFAVAMRRAEPALGGHYGRRTPQINPMEQKERYAEIEAKQRYIAQEREALLLKLVPNFYAPVPTDHWAYAAMRELQGNGLWKQFGYSTSFDGSIEWKRSAFAWMLYRVRDNLPPTSLGGHPKLTPEAQGLLDKLREEFRAEISALNQVGK